MHFSVKKILPHLYIIVGFIIVSIAYFNPVLKGKQIFQSDIVQFTGMAKQQIEFREQTGEETYWTNSAFGGMPTYQLGAHYPHNYIKKLDLTLRFLPRPADYLFLYFIGFYILLLVLKVDFKLAALGALAFGFSTYLIIILGVGHNSKAHAIAYMPLVLSGILLTFQRKYVFGFLLTAIAMALEIVANHFQMTYYLMLLVIVLGIAYFIDSYRKKTMPHFIKSVAILCVAVILSVGLNSTNIMATQEYVKESTRGKSELTINPDKTPKEFTSGLDKDYITEYSYGITESMNLFVPGFMGGGSYEDVGKNSETYEYFKKLGATPIQAAQEVKHTPTYWGDQPIVEAPAYLGAVVLFLFVFSLFMVKGRLKWWLLGGAILSLLLSFGKNIGFITDLFIDYFPLYNKFRAVSSIQVILELCVPILGVFGLAKLFDKAEKEEVKLKALKYTAIITGGLALVFLLFGSSLFDFVGNNDGRYIQGYGQGFIDAVKEDRKTFFTNDVLRTLVLVVLAAGIFWMYLKKKLTHNLVVILLVILIVIDLVVVDRRYVNNENFVSSILVNKPFQANSADLEILKDTTHYRVFDLTSGNTKASYFHNSLDGYHAAKMKRYNDIFNFYISKNHLEVINMLNTKYIISQDEEGNPIAYANPEANGNAWFIEELKPVNSANEEILALDSLDTKEESVFDINHFQNGFKPNKIINFEVDSLASIQLIDYKPNYLKYESNNSKKGFAVFSENYYGAGWQAYLDGEKVEHIRVNYVLRGMEIPSGKHWVEYIFEPLVIKTGSTIALASSILVGLLIIGGLFYQFKNKL